MVLEGSCHCRAVRFRVRSRYPHPFMRCYCSICRKTAGGGGYAVNLAADYRSMEVFGAEHVRTYHARMRDPETGREHESRAERRFCGSCGSALWLWDPRWPDLVHPFASAVDTPLPVPPERTHLMLEFKAPWVVPSVGPHDREFQRYPDESIAAWHERLGLADD